MHHPPKYFYRFFRWFCHAEYYEELAGDIEELFYEEVATKGLTVAKKNYRKENDAMDNLGDAVDALVKAAKIAIDQSADEIDSKINDAIERLQNISTPFIF